MQMQLSLFANAIDFIEKGIEEFIAAQGEEGKKRELKYAILHIAQGFELVLKQILSEKNPLFLLADIDSDKSDPQTVNTEKALKRISKLYAGEGMQLSKKHLDILERIRTKRNELTHYEVNLNEHHAISMIAQTFPVLDYLLKSFLNKTLIDEVSETVWEAFIKIEHIHKEYSNELRNKYTFIEYGGHWLTCGGCQMRTIADVDGELRCVYCECTFVSEEEVIRKMKGNGVKLDVIYAFIKDKNLLSVTCEDCFEDTVVYSRDDGCAICLSCEYSPYIDFIFCPNCLMDTGLVEIHFDREGNQEETATCMRCHEEIEPERCSRCCCEQFNLQTHTHGVLKLCSSCSHQYANQ